MAVISVSHLDTHPALDKMLEPFLDVSTATVLAATSSCGPNFAASIYEFQYKARFDFVMNSANQQVSAFWIRQYETATRYLRIVPGGSLLGFEVGKKMQCYLGDDPRHWNALPRQFNIWGDPVLGVWGDDLPHRMSTCQPWVCQLPAGVDISLWATGTSTIGAILQLVLHEVTLHSPRFGALLMETPTGNFMFKVGMTLADLLDGLGLGMLIVASAVNGEHCGERKFSGKR